MRVGYTEQNIACISWQWGAMGAVGRGVAAFSLVDMHVDLPRAANQQWARKLVWAKAKGDLKIEAQGGLAPWFGVPREKSGGRGSSAFAMAAIRKRAAVDRDAGVGIVAR